MPRTVNPALLYYISLTSWKEIHPLKAERYLGRLCTSEERNLWKANSRNPMDGTNLHVDPTADLKISLDFGITTYRKYRLTSAENKSKETSRDGDKALTYVHLSL